MFAAADGMRLVYPVPQPGEPVLPVKGARWPLEWDGKPDGVMTVTDPASGVVRSFSTPCSLGRPSATVHLPWTAGTTATAPASTSNARLTASPPRCATPAATTWPSTPQGTAHHRPAPARRGPLPVRARRSPRRRYGRDALRLRRGGQPHRGHQLQRPAAAVHLRRTRAGSPPGRTATAPRSRTSTTPAAASSAPRAATASSPARLAYDDESRTTTYTDSLGHRPRTATTPRARSSRRPTRSATPPAPSGTREATSPSRSPTRWAAPRATLRRRRQPHRTDPAGRHPCPGHVQHARPATGGRRARRRDLAPHIRRPGQPAHHHRPRRRRQPTTATTSQAT